MIWIVLMYICLGAGLILLGFGIYGFVYTPSLPSEILNTEVTNRNKSKCDPNDNEYDAAVTCETDNDCKAKCVDENSRCISRYELDPNTQQMKPTKTCVNVGSTPMTNCNANKGGELILQPSDDGSSMNFGCQCRYTDYTSENPNSDNFCQLLPSVCKNGEFIWDATKTAPEDAECICQKGKYKHVNNYTGVPECIETKKLGSGVVFDPETGEYKNLPLHSGVYPCLGENSFC